MQCLINNYFFIRSKEMDYAISKSKMILRRQWNSNYRNEVNC